MSQTSSAPMLPNLPPELWLQILAHLPRDALWLSIRSVSTAFRQLATTAFYDTQLPQTEINILCVSRNYRWTLGISSLHLQFSRFSRDRSRVYFKEKHIAAVQHPRRCVCTEDAPFWKEMEVLSSFERSEEGSEIPEEKAILSFHPVLSSSSSSSFPVNLPAIQINPLTRELSFDAEGAFYLACRPYGQVEEQGGQKWRTKLIALEACMGELTYTLERKDRVCIVNKAGLRGGCAPWMGGGLGVEFG